MTCMHAVQCGDIIFVLSKIVEYAFLLTLHCHVQIEEDDFDPDTRNYRQPRLKEGGLPTNNFYGKKDASGPARPQSRGAAQDSGEQTFSRTRQAAATRKRKVEQVRIPCACLKPFFIEAVLP